MTEPTPTWPTDADEQKRLLDAYRHAYRAHVSIIGPIETRDWPLYHETTELLAMLRGRMSDRTRLLASQWERKLWKEAGR